MTEPAVLPPAADVAPTYALVEPQTPCLTGNRLWLANKLSRTPLAGYLFRMVAARAGLDKVSGWLHISWLCQNGGRPLHRSVLVVV
jgi:hypothetical protein